jgi:hypothetical protein
MIYGIESFEVNYGTHFDRAKMEKRDSFINRKRPAVEGLVEDLIGPSSQLDELISGNPLPEQIQIKNEAERIPSKNKPG